ncbi:MAG TPA: hypothetical protein VHO06_22915 [Polyangia bacterium]|nr:hypothetical protein [Polyangia bacterium]
MFTTNLVTSQLALADLDARRLTTWTLPTPPNTGPQSIAFDGSGRVLFLAAGGGSIGVIGRFDPITGLEETWSIPVTIVDPEGDFAWKITAASDGTVFFNINGFTHPAELGRLDPATGVFTSWVTPEPPIFGLAADGSGSVFFQEQGNTLNVARLVPATNTLTEWTFVDDVEFTQNMIFDSGKLVFGNNGPTAIVSLDPSVAGVDSTLSPTVTDPVVPSSAIVTPVVTTRDPHRHGQARGAVSASTPTSAGPFTVFPTVFPSWIAGDGTGTIYFTGGDIGASVARLSP